MKFYNVFRCGLLGLGHNVSDTKLRFELSHRFVSYNFQGKPVEFVQQGENGRRWLSDYHSKANATPLNLDTVDGGLSLVILHKLCLDSIQGISYFAHWIIVISYTPIT